MDKPEDGFELDLTFQHILKCVLKLTASEIDVYLALQKHPGIDVGRLSEYIGRDKSGVYRTLQTLMEKSLVERKYRILKNGGYRYIYYPVPLEELRIKLIKELEAWYEKLSEMVDSLKERAAHIPAEAH